MYQVRCDNQVIYDLRDEELIILSPKLNEEVNKTGAFNFIIPPKNPMYDNIKTLKSIITIYQDNEELFRGRVLKSKLDFYNRKQVECEGELSFLLDSIQRPYQFQGSPNDLFRQFINTHNSQVEPAKQFVLRTVDVPDNNNYINRENSNHSNTWESINDKLIDTNGGYLESGPLENGTRYIDFISKYEHINSQVIMFGENLLDITQYIKGEDIKTAIIPLGAKNESTGERVTIKSVNDNKDYIYDETAVSLFGWIWDTVEYDDVTLPQNLLTRGRKYLSSVINESLTIELSAVDLHHLDCDIEKFRKGDLVRVISKPHNLDRYFQVSKLSLSLNNPKESTLVLGQTFKTLTSNQLNETKNMNNLIIVSTQEIQKNKQEISEAKNDIDTINETIVTLDGKIGRVYRIKGNIANYTRLQELEDMEAGDVYNVLDTGANYVWTGEIWDKFSETVDLSNFYNKNQTYSKEEVYNKNETYTKEEVNQLINGLGGNV